MHFTASADSDHAVEIDGPPDLGGANLGTRPMELMLMGIGGCTATDIVHILTKSRQSIKGCRVEISAERAPTEPQVFTRIHLLVRISGDAVNRKKVERAVALSADKYCSASILMQRAGVAVSHEVSIETT